MSTYTPPPSGSRIIIVGAGAFGLSTAYALSLKKKYQISVFDRYQVPVPDAASTDISKVVRMDYGLATQNMQLMIEGLPLWEQWNKERAAQGKTPVFHKTGAVFFSKNGQYSDYGIQSMQSIREAGYGHVIEELTPQAIMERFPHFKLAVENGYDTAYFNKEAGWCDSSEAIKHVYEKCVNNGIQFILGANTGCFEKLYRQENKVLGIQTKDQKIHRADRVIIATGPWTASLIDLGDKLTATGQIVIHFKPPASSIFSTFKNQPVWSADPGFYGFPTTTDGKLKVALHSLGYYNLREIDGKSVPRTQVTHQDDTIPLKALKEFREFLAKFFPQTTSMDVYYSRVCWYSDSQDSNFLVTPHPGLENIIIASGDSGHGMKFLPVVGLKIAQIVEGIESDYSRAWGWREVNSDSAAFDAMRACKSADMKPLQLEDTNNEDTKMCTAQDLKAAVPRL
ncbi:FAD dependent oxidoreductase [Phascolomyces articulosus]|uniref:FAD dependent oxidoreductase n=1 Tax=Phascolomyces articulosus TaxID=60185 RepID=A0AAD5JYQ0_9FUNG|nr:FAD dependent oxidoreductase [Phascolomyces articulosus]